MKIIELFRNYLRNFLEIESVEHRIEVIEELILHEKSRDLGFAVLKKHLNRSDIPLPNFMGKEIEQD